MSKYLIIGTFSLVMSQYGCTDNYPDVCEEMYTMLRENAADDAELTANLKKGYARSLKEWKNYNQQERDKEIENCQTTVIMLKAARQLQ